MIWSPRATAIVNRVLKLAALYVVVSLLGEGLKIYSHHFPYDCGPTRLAALLGIVATFGQAYLWAHPEDFQGRVHSGHTWEQLLTTWLWVIAGGAAILAGFGDLLPKAYSGTCS